MVSAGEQEIRSNFIFFYGQCAQKNIGNNKFDQISYFFMVSAGEQEIRSNYIFFMVSARKQISEIIAYSGVGGPHVTIHFNGEII